MNVIKKLYCFVIISSLIIPCFSQAPSIEWQKCYGDGGGQICYCIKPTSDGGSISCGTSAFGTLGPAWILKLDATGTIIWDKSIGGGGADKYPYSIQQTIDGDYIVSGYIDTIVN